MHELRKHKRLQLNSFSFGKKLLWCGFTYKVEVVPHKAKVDTP
jgi:hypothetical protein